MAKTLPIVTRSILANLYSLHGDRAIYCGYSALPTGFLRSPTESELLAYFTDLNDRMMGLKNLAYLALLKNHFSNLVEYAKELEQIWLRVHADNPAEDVYCLTEEAKVKARKIIDRTNAQVTV